MSGIPLVRKSGIESQVIGPAFAIDIDDIVFHIVDRRREIISRTAVILHGGRNLLDRDGGFEGTVLRGKRRKVLAHPALQILQHLRGLRKGQIQRGNQGGIRKLRVFCDQGKHGIIILLKVLIQESLDLRNGTVASRGGGEQIFIIFPPLGEIVEPLGIFAFSLQNREGVGGLLVSGL